MEMNALESYPDVLTVKDVCDILDVSRKTVYNLLKNSIIPYRKIGRQYRILKWVQI